MILQYWKAGLFSTPRSEAKVEISFRTGCAFGGEKFHKIYATVIFPSEKLATGTFPILSSLDSDI